MERSDIDRLNEIHDELKALVTEAAGIVEKAGGLACQRAKCYWIAHILTALDHDNEYLGSSICTMQYTIHELSAQLEEEERKN